MRSSIDQKMKLLNENRYDVSSKTAVLTLATDIMNMQAMETQLLRSLQDSAQKKRSLQDDIDAMTDYVAKRGVRLAM